MLVQCYERESVGTFLECKLSLHVEKSFHQTLQV
jgi:hypothetical protein